MFFARPIKEIDALELARWLEEKNGKIRLIDVRTPQEFAAGTVPGAEHLPLQMLPQRMNELDPEETYVFICRSGQRSASACQFLAQYGFENVYNLRGGVIGWAASGGQMAALPQAV